MATKKKAKAKAKATVGRKAPAPTKKPKASVAKARAAAKPKASAKKKVTTKTKKRAAVGARPKKAAAPRARKAPAARAKPIRRLSAKPLGMPRRDGAGHLNPQYAAELLDKSYHPPADPESFVERPRSNDDLVEELGEEVVQEATTAEYEGQDILNQEVPEEQGGPFVETRASDEFAHGVDPSNPKGAKREPFPRT
jgi:hypothetical protein